MPKIMERLLNAFPELYVVHQTGGRHGDSTNEAYVRAGVELRASAVTRISMIWRRSLKRQT